MPITQNENAVLRLLERITRWLRGFVWLNTAPMDWLQHPDHDVPSGQWDRGSQVSFCLHETTLEVHMKKEYIASTRINWC
jgi:hypothetical protein